MKYISKITLSLILTSFYGAANSGELEIRSAIRENSKNLFLKEDFTGLEKLFLQYDSSQEETPSGVLKIYLLNDGIGEAMPLQPRISKEEDYIKKEELTKRWIAAYPNSIWAHMTYAITFRDRAWKLRGNGVASTVPKDAWEAYYKYLNLQNDYYEKNKLILSGNVLWYLEKLRNRQYLSKQSEFNGLYKEAKNKNMQDIRLDYMMVDSLSPRWGGSAEEIDDFIKLASKNISATSSDYVYSRLYAYAEQLHYPHMLFEKTKADWPKMKRGFEERLIKYPDVWNDNIFAQFACQAKDKDTTRKLMAKIGSTPALTVWQPNGVEWFNYCRNWALSQ